jgi:hypothetical protein
MEGPNKLEHFVPGKHLLLIQAVLHFRLGFLPYPLILDKAEKIHGGQTLQLIWIFHQ